MRKFALKNSIGKPQFGTKPPLKVAAPKYTKRIDCGRLTGGIVNGFDVDQFFSGGAAFDYSPYASGTYTNPGVSNPPNISVYRYARYYASGSPVVYTIPSLVTTKSYLVRLHMAEPNATGHARYGNYSAAGATVGFQITDYCVYESAGSQLQVGVVIECTIQPDASGNITITYGSGNAPIVQGIEILEV